MLHLKNQNPKPNLNLSSVSVYISILLLQVTLTSRYEVISEIFLPKIKFRNELLADLVTSAFKSVTLLCI